MVAGRRAREDIGWVGQKYGGKGSDERCWRRRRWTPGAGQPGTRRDLASCRGIWGAASERGRAEEPDKAKAEGGRAPSGLHTGAPGCPCLRLPSAPRPLDLPVPIQGSVCVPLAAELSSICRLSFLPRLPRPLLSITIPGISLRSSSPRPALRLLLQIILHFQIVLPSSRLPPMPPLPA